MSKTVTRASVKTVLKIGLVEAPVSLFKAVGETKGRKWETADAEGNPQSGTGSSSLPSPPGDPLGGASTPEESAAPSAPIGGAVPSAGQQAEPAPEEETEPAAAPAKPRKGIRKGDGAFVDLSGQIEEIGERSRLERMEIVSFIDRGHVPHERIIASYYLSVGEGEGLPPGKLLKVISEAMQRTGRVAVVRFSKRKGQTLGVLRTRRDGALLLEELCFAEQFREPNARCLSHNHSEVTDAEAGHAAELVNAMAGRRDSLDGIRDLRAVMEEELASRAEEGELDSYELPEDEAVDPATVELGELLKASVAGVANG